jgi:hypothetical protein
MSGPACFLLAFEQAAPMQAAAWCGPAAKEKISAQARNATNPLINRRMTSRPKSPRSAAPPRYQSQFYGQKQPRSRSALSRQLRSAETVDSLSHILRAKSPSAAEHDVALAEWIRLRNVALHPNRELVFKFDWRTMLWEEDVIIARELVLKFLRRLMKRSAVARAKYLRADEVMQFLFVPEIWSRTGDKVDLHYHGAVRVADAVLPWIDSQKAKIEWGRILAPYGITGSVHIAPINDIHCLSRYHTKQCDIDWVLQNTIEPIDLQRAVTGTTKSSA